MTDQPWANGMKLEQFESLMATRESERAFQRRVVALAESWGWTAWHDQDSRRNRAGLPDLILFRERVVWAELKRARGQLSEAQKDFRELLLTARAEYYCWRPSDFEEIVRVLR